MNTPNDANTEQLEVLTGGAPDRPGLLGNFGLPKLNAETLANGRVNEIDARAEKVFGRDLDAAKATAAAMDRIGALMPKEIDLRNLGNKLDVRYEYQGDRVGWSCWDENSYDGAPDSESNHIGYGPEKEDAHQDLIEKLGVEAAEEPRTRASRVIYHSGNREEPNEYADKREPDFDDDLEETR